MTTPQVVEGDVARKTALGVEGAVVGVRVDLFVPNHVSSLVPAAEHSLVAKGRPSETHFSMFGANGFARTRPALVIPDIRPLSWAPLVVVTRRAGEQINFALPILGQRNDTDLRAEDLLRVVKACRWHGASSPFDSNLARHSRRLPAPVG